ncbi:hypothetical protein [Pedobacter deserti]|uniref:hypothetical protein n=1 Tax=Pedobacter deserti TaxID=2817382 RepID=UPI0021093DAE|nr:hypothetical protein [Pedobacter sp. SYSU D00382]
MGRAGDRKIDDQAVVQRIEKGLLVNGSLILVRRVLGVATLADGKQEIVKAYYDRVK